MMTLRNLIIAILLLAFSNGQSASAAAAPENTTTTTPASVSTTSTSSTTTTSTPSPVPVPLPPTWTVKSSNLTCLLLRGNFTFAVTYTTPEGNSVSDRVAIPESAKASGSCGPFINSLVLTWGKSNLTFMFIKKPTYDAGVDTGEGSYSLTTIFGRLTVENPNDAIDDGGSSSSTSKPSNRDDGDSFPSSSSSEQTFYISVREPGFMSTSLHNSYSCESYQSVAADKAGNVYLEMRGIQVEAFHNGTDANFNESQPCYKDTMSSIMSLVGYTALGVLVAGAAGYLLWKKFGRSGYTEV